MVPRAVACGSADYSIPCAVACGSNDYKTWVVTFKYLPCDIFHSQHNGAAGEYRLRQRLPVAVPRAVACGSSLLQVPAGVILKSRLFCWVSFMLPAR